MKLPGPIQKAPRELRRLGDQIDDVLVAFLGLSLSRIYSRLFVQPRVRVVQGMLPFGTKVAIYLIFPSQGVLDSHFIALDYIRQSGYSPVVVSNLPLSQGDKAALLDKCATLILRPNSGYDFGGYRDALRLLGSRVKGLDHLAIFNDSSWFPVDTDRHWLAEAEARSLDFVGSVSSGGVDLATPFDRDPVPWSIDAGGPWFHYCSYSLLIGPAILRDPRFGAFWRNYRPASFKSYTIRRGEIGLSQWVVTNGFTHGETLDARNLPALLAELPTHRLLEIARNAITFDRPKPTDTRHDVLSASPPDHSALVRLLLREVVKSGQAYCLQDFDTRERTGMFVKKLPIAMSRTAADQTLRILDHRRSPQAAAFRAEALALYHQKYGAEAEPPTAAPTLQPCSADSATTAPSRP